MAYFNMADTADAIMKELYTEDVMKNLTYKDFPLYAMVPKMEDFVGDAMPIPLTIGNVQNRSVTASTAFAATTTSSQKKFVVTQARDYNRVVLDNLTMLASASKRGGFTDALTLEVNCGIAGLAHSVATALYGNGGGSIGQVSAATTGTSITLKEPADVVNFDVNMELKFSTADGTSGALKAGSVTVTDINRDTGVLTIDAATAIASGNGVAADDHIFVSGDWGAKLKGLGAWIPSSAPSSTAFFGLDRTTDVTRLAGVRVASTDVTGLPIEEKILHGCARLGREGARPDVCFVSYEKFRDLEISLSSKVVYEDVDMGGFGFSSILLRGPRGNVRIIPDQCCPNSKAYILTLDSWKLCTTGPAIQILDRDGKFLRVSNADAYEVRMAFYGQLACNAPGWNAVVDLS